MVNGECSRAPSFTCYHCAKDMGLNEDMWQLKDSAHAFLGTRSSCKDEPRFTVELCQQCGPHSFTDTQYIMHVRGQGDGSACCSWCGLESPHMSYLAIAHGDVETLPFTFGVIACDRCTTAWGGPEAAPLHQLFELKPQPSAATWAAIERAGRDAQFPDRVVSAFWDGGLPIYC